jgi:hypothetical protein
LLGAVSLRISFESDFGAGKIEKTAFEVTKFFVILLNSKLTN